VRDLFENLYSSETFISFSHHRVLSVPGLP
jgi:hypothetical protein